MSVDLIHKIKTGQLYRHYKSDYFKNSSDLNFYHHLYQIIGLSKHTETEDILVIYKPLYFNNYLETGVKFFAREIQMFLEKINIDGQLKNRFELVRKNNLPKT